MDGNFGKHLQPEDSRQVVIDGYVQVTSALVD